MRVSIFGLGYIGSISAAWLVENGHEVLGLDARAERSASFEAGRSPVAEPGLDAILEQGRRKGGLRAAKDPADAVANSDVCFICAGTPAKPSGELNLAAVQDVTRYIVEVLHKAPKPYVVVYRSTMLPGSTALLSRHFLFGSARAPVEVLYYPAFFRQGSALADLRDPPIRVIGTRQGKPMPPQLQSLLPPVVEVANWETAELLKFACNVFHALKVSFSNEMGRLAKKTGVNGQSLLSLMCQDRLNISTNYLKPGNAFGGSSLLQDVHALSHQGRQLGLSLPVLDNILPSNQQHLQSLLNHISQRGQSEVVILGLTFKPGSDDLRGSAMVEVAQQLLAHGCQVRIFDPELDLSRLAPTNRRVVEAKIPRLPALLKNDLSAAVGARGLILAAKACVSATDLARCVTPQHVILDLQGWPELAALGIPYEGICW